MSAKVAAPPEVVPLSPRLVGKVVTPQAPAPRPPLSQARAIISDMQKKLTAQWDALPALVATRDLTQVRNRIGFMYNDQLVLMDHKTDYQRQLKVHYPVTPHPIPAQRMAMDLLFRDKTNWQWHVQGVVCTELSGSPTFHLFRDTTPVWLGITKVTHLGPVRYTVGLGSFRLWVDPSKSPLLYWRQALGPTPPGIRGTGSVGNPHPHIYRSGAVCWGGGEKAVARLCENGDITGLWDMFNSLMHRANPINYSVDITSVMPGPLQEFIYLNGSPPPLDSLPDYIKLQNPDGTPWVPPDPDPKPNPDQAPAPTPNEERLNGPWPTGFVCPGCGIRFTKEAPRVQDPENPRRHRCIKCTFGVPNPRKAAQ